MNAEEQKMLKMKKVLSFFLIITCLSSPVYKAYSDNKCLVYALDKNNSLNVIKSDSTIPIQQVYLVKIQLQGFWESLLYNNYWSIHFYTIDAIISLLFGALFFILKIEFESLNDGNFINNSVSLSAALIILSMGYGLSKILFLDDIYNTFINEHLPKGLVQISDVNSGVFWAFVPGAVAVSTYEMCKYAKKMQSKLVYLTLRDLS